MPPTVLHVPYTYFPDPCGGTEVYVRGLARRLCTLGYPSHVAAPGSSAAAYVDGGVQVFRFAVDSAPRIELAYGGADETAAEGFAEIFRQVRPDIVHLHARTAAVSERLIDIAQAGGARVVFSYHTPTASCSRGDMMLFGQTPCDGLLREVRCGACTLQGLGAPQPLAWLAAGLRPVVGGALRGSSRLRAPALTTARVKAIRRFLAKPDHLVAVCAWVAEVLRRNGAPANKLTLSRQGVELAAAPPVGRPPAAAGADLRIAYFGRLDWTKGPDLLVDAVRRAAGARVTLDLFGIDQSSGGDQGGLGLAGRAAGDARVRLLPPVAPERVIGTMAGYDLIAIPSRCLETGPLTALEAFAAGTPVLGARLGGVAELVRDGVDGVLVSPGDVAAWTSAIEGLDGDRGRAAALRQGVRPPRTMDAAADDMAALYGRLTAETAA